LDLFLELPLCWQVQTAAEAADVEMSETKGLDIDALVFVPMVLGKVSDAMESKTGPQI
jgi:hypothetical protein